ncbi:sensor histidine kinase [Pandoraea bronchicola]|uniref:Signal transduction histidine kinase n=1 Tax=Pandoraea bronchicola TaxID=2508287 RepID=A0A5E5BWQ7_9BURK|nr:histidine kinase [Pandoraea bronchicola]VVE89562.1 signal transduction histidine kinase [Pandoraea bronchicola]
MTLTSKMKPSQSVKTTYAGPVKVTRGLWQTFFRELAGVILFNTAIALILFFVGFGGTFVQNFVFSQCIGISITVLVDGGRRAVWRDGAPSMVPFLLLVGFGCAAGLVLGILMGTVLLGLPMSMWRPSNGHSVPIVLLIALLATGIGTYHGWSRARLAQLREAAAHQALREAAAQQQLVRAQLQTMQAQLEPHFLFNVLANLDSLIVSDPARARTLLGHLNRFLRASLAATRAEVTTLADEFALLETLMAIQQVRFGERLRYTLDLPEDCRTLQVPPMLVQPLVENAIKHGVEPLAGGAAVDVSARRERSAHGGWQVVLRVADDGAGFRAAVGAGGDERVGGIGLTNIRERLRVLYGDAARLTLTEGVPRGVVATLRLPVGLPGPQTVPTA